MIFNEEEIREYGREKRVLFPKKPKQEEKPKSDNSPLLMSAVRNVFDALADVAGSVKKGFNSINNRLDELVKFQNSPAKPEKKSNEWEFKIIRDVSNNIQKIEARRK